MGKLFVHYVEAETVQCCVSCGIHLSSHDSIVSKAFQGRHGRAYLFSDVVNVGVGPTENRLLLTGLHVVCDIYCNACDTRLGWKYVEAFEESQKYKEGKFILEKALIVKEEALRWRDAETDARAERHRRVADGDEGRGQRGEDGEEGEEEDDDDEDELDEEDDDTQEDDAAETSRLARAAAEAQGMRTSSER